MGMSKAIHTGQPVGRKVSRPEKLPHERDESVGVTDGVQSAHVQQAARDLRRGLQDTDRGPVMDRTYKRLKQS